MSNGKLLNFCGGSNPPQWSRWSFSHVGPKLKSGELHFISKRNAGFGSRSLNVERTSILIQSV